MRNRAPAGYASISKNEVRGLRFTQLLSGDLMQIKDIDGKTIVQIKVPVCITIQMDESDAQDMTHEELAGIADEFIDEVQSTWNATTNGALETHLHPRGRMDRVPMRCDIARNWDELPVEDCEIMSNDSGFFEE